VNILINPEAIPPKEFNQAANAYKLVFEKYPDTLSAKRAMISLGTLYLAKGENLKAREMFKKAIKNDPGNLINYLNAQLAIGKSYENEGEWATALTGYRKLIKDYPNTEVGLNLPMYIAEHFRKAGDIVKRNEAYDTAIRHYKRLAEKNPDTVLGYRAENLIVNCYLNKGEWRNAASSLEKMVMDYPMAKGVPLSMKMLADLSVRKLNNPGRAIKFFERFLEQYSEHPIADYLNEGWKELKNVPNGE